MTFPPYPKYKSSGVAWLGDVPAHWEVKRLGYGARLQGGYAFASDKFDSEGVPVVRMNNLKRGALDISGASCVPPENCLDDFSLVEGDLLWGMSGSIGETGSLGNFARVRACDLPAQLNQRVGRFCVVDACCSLDFFTYIIQTNIFYDQILLRVTGTAQFNVSSDQVESARLSFPPLPEQTAIAAFLDRETARLDQLMVKKRELIEHLKEKRTALISDCVTGKLQVIAHKHANGTLSFSVKPSALPTKPSGIEWLGDIPDHWEVMPTRRALLEHRQGYYSDAEYVDSGVKLLRITDLREFGKVDFTHCPHVENRAELSPFLLEPTDFVFARTGGAGSFGLIETLSEPVVYASYLIRFRFAARAFPRYLRHFFLSLGFQQAVRQNIHGGVNQNVHAEDIKNQYLALPPLPEQTAIAAFLDAETAKLDALAAKVEEAIERLQEYRTALITAAVTGKIDVRKAQP